MSVAIVTHNSAATIARCLAATATASTQTHVYVWDNASTDATLRILERIPDRPTTVVTSPVNIGFGAAMNRLVPRTDGEYVLLLNPDCVLSPGTIDALVDALDADANLGAVGPTLVGTERGRSQAGGGWEPSIRRLVLEIPALPSIAPRTLGSSGVWARRAALTHSGGAMPVDWASGACLLLRRSDWQDVGGFDERWFMYCEDIDLGRRLRRAGRSSALLQNAHVRHVGGASHRSERAARALQRASMIDYVEHGGRHAPHRWMLRVLVTVYFATRQVIPAPSGRSIMRRLAHRPSSSA